VFLVYGMHLCFNVVCGSEGAGHAVLVRGVEPDGDARGDGPGRVTRALGIGREAGGVDLVTSPGLFLLEPEGARRAAAASPRVGVGYAGDHAERPWRFFDPASRSVSRPPPNQIGRGRAPR
jgi:DNA-3-methyladenine glycosylase